MATIRLLTADEFEQDGGYNVRTGELNRLYTLRHDQDEQYAVYTDGGSLGENMDVRVVRRSYHLRNLGKDWADVVNRLPAIMAEVCGPKDEYQIFVPGWVGGVLDPNNPPTPYVVSDVIPFGQYEGCTIDEIRAKEKGLDYLLWIATGMHIPDSNRMKKAFVDHLKVVLEPELTAFYKSVERQREQAEAEKAIRLAENAKRAARQAEVAEALRGTWYNKYYTSDVDAVEQGEDYTSFRFIAKMREAYAKAFGRDGSWSYAYHFERFDFLMGFSDEDPGEEKAWVKAAKKAAKKGQEGALCQ
jgi:hypothetical protein